MNHIIKQKKTKAQTQKEQIAALQAQVALLQEKAEADREMKAGKLGNVYDEKVDGKATGRKVMTISKERLDALQANEHGFYTLPIVQVGKSGRRWEVRVPDEVDESAESGTLTDDERKVLALLVKKAGLSL